MVCMSQLSSAACTTSPITPHHHCAAYHPSCHTSPITLHCVASLMAFTGEQALRFILLMMNVWSHMSTLLGVHHVLCIVFAWGVGWGMFTGQCQSMLCRGDAWQRRGPEDPWSWCALVIVWICRGIGSCICHCVSHVSIVMVMVTNIGGCEQAKGGKGRKKTYCGLGRGTQGHTWGWYLGELVP